MNKIQNKRIVVAMSGGVDSSTTAAILKGQGFDVIGISMQLWDYTDGERERFGSCCSIDDINDARRVADKLDIPFYVLNMEEVFSKEVVDYFVSSYLKGETPNPCLKCNQILKFEVLLKKAMELEADYLATGHYARIVYDNAACRFRLLKGVDKTKDQSYFLFTLTQKQMSGIIFPLGDMTKQDVRNHARRFGLKTAEKKESQDICFIEDRDYFDFILKRTGVIERGGDIVDRNGNILGRHNGLYKYTIGQRKGLGIARGKPQYVIDIDTKTGRVVVGDREEAFSNGLTAKELNWIGIEKFNEPIEVESKIRYRHKGVKSIVKPLGEGRAMVEFSKPECAVTPGQAVVFYKGDEVIGGGWIEKIL
ncbi:MAG: tRNA 2-thiouridine(34) synthase MnmA [Deltaproteobacteria bacterium]|nr:tRNA 2-thiouridine(34) synthase MnmA [Deltaproteobacteria bacterium]